MRPPVSETKQNEKSWLKHNIRKLNKVDTTYIEPQRYNYAFMIQNTNTYELYRIQSNLGYSVTFAPNMSLRVGPYFGYRWIFIGYTIDVTHLYDEVNDRTIATRSASTSTTARRATATISEAAISATISIPNPCAT